MRYLITLLLIMIRITLQSDWLQDSGADASHPHRRRFTRKYQAKKNIVKKLWINACLLMLLNPALPVIFIIALPVTFLSVLILDETSE